jgi:hypothetical protein
LLIIAWQYFAVPREDSAARKGPRPEYSSIEQMGAESGSFDIPEPMEQR